MKGVDRAGTHVKYGLECHNGENFRIFLLGSHWSVFISD